MISAEDAMVIAREAFPDGPEVLVERLNVHVEYRPLGGCDGFCGYVGALKNRITGRTADEVEADFWQRHQQTLDSTRMNSVEGREYIRLRISQWY